MEMEQTSSEQTVEQPAAQLAEQQADAQAAEKQAAVQDSGKPEKKPKQKGEKTKWLALITYAIAFLLFVAFAVLPADFNFGEGWFDTTVAGKFLPAIYSIAGIAGEDAPAFNLFGFNWEWNAFGAETAINIGEWLVLLLGIVAVMAIACLIVVLACKKNKPTAAVRAASLIEVLTLVILSVFIFYEISAAISHTGEQAYGWHWSLIGAYFGILVMLILTGFAYGKHASGLAKVFVFVLSAVSVLMMFNLAKLFNLTDGILENGLFAIGDKSFEPVGEEQIPALVSGFGFDYLQALLIGNFKAIGGNAIMLQIGMFITVIMVFVNFIFDIGSMGMTTRKWILVTNLVRFILEVIGVVFVLIMVFVNGCTVAVPLWALLAIAFVQLILNVIRLAKFASWKENKKETATAATEKKAGKAPAEHAPNTEEKRERRQRREAPALADGTAAKNTETASAAVAEAPVDFSATIYPHTKRPSPFAENVVYSGPTDDFINTLSDCEKAEFAKVFLADRVEPLARIPEYKIGGENSKFFRAIFIYYGRVCDLVSDGLIGKLYNQVTVG